MREIAAHAARANAEPDHRDEDQQRQRGVGLEMGRRRLDARNERGPVGDEDEDEQRADEGAIGRGLDPHRVADLAVHGVDDQFEGRLGRRRDERQPAGDEDAAEDQHRHDRPGGDHACGDRHRAQMEKRDAGERRGHGAASRTLRMTTERAMRTPSAIASSGSAPSRLANVSKPPRRAKRPIIKRDRRRHATARGEQAGVPPHAAEIEQPEHDPGGEMRGEAEKHGPGRQASNERKLMRSSSISRRTSSRAPARASGAARSRTVRS